MIDIESAIVQSKNMENVSDGGSACFDFDDVVLVKYICETKYLKNGEHVREKSEEIMDAINKKNSDIMIRINGNKYENILIRISFGEYSITQKSKKKRKGSIYII